jgi:hypothetical protein
VKDGSLAGARFATGNIVTEVQELRSRGVAFEEYELPGLTTIGGKPDKDASFVIFVTGMLIGPWRPTRRLFGPFHPIG